MIEKNTEKEPKDINIPIMNINENNKEKLNNLNSESELEELRRKLNNYDAVQDELNYYKNLSLSYHKVFFLFIFRKMMIT